MLLAISSLAVLEVNRFLFFMLLSTASLLRKLHSMDGASKPLPLT